MAATDFNWAGTAVPGGDIGCINTDASQINVGNVVIIDATNSLTTTGVTGFAAGLPAPGVKNAGANAYPFGVAIENIPVGAQGRIRRLGIAQCFANGAITAGATVQAAASAQVSAPSTGHPQLGQALNTTVNAADPVLVALDISNNA